MKRFITAILCITLIVFGMTVPAFANDLPDFRVGNIKTEGGEISLPVYITALPEGLENIMAIDFEYSFDDTVLEYVSTETGTASGTLFTARSGKVSWADTTDLAVSDAKITASNIGLDYPFFTLVFKVLTTDFKDTFVNIEKVELTGGLLQPGDVFEIVKASPKLYNNVPGRVVYGSGDSSDTDDENSGEGSDNSGSASGGSEGSGNNESGDDNTSSDDSGNTGSDNGGNTDNENQGSSSGSSGGGDVGGGPLKPNTDGDKPNNNTSSGNSSGSSGSSSSGSSSSGSSSSSGGSSAPAISGSTPVTQQPVATAPSKASDVFSDVEDSHWAAQYALTLYNKGIVSGDSQKRANLENRITREETSKLALLVNGIEADASATLDVADADKVSDWAKGFFATAIKMGIFSGYEDGTVRPLNQITREEMVTVIIKSLGIEIDTNAAVSFADGNQITWSAPYVAKAVELGFVNGYSDNTFKPGNAITRAEAFTIFARVLEYKNK